jgi:photosystem II stability/assembly factor-like uncharacterized protein
MIKKLTYLIILFMFFLSACSSGSEINNSDFNDKDKLSEDFLMVGNSGSIYGLNYHNNESYSYDILNMPYFRIKSTIVNESKLMVAVGDYGVIMVTDDLINYESGWKMVQSKTQENLSSIAITTEGGYIAVGDKGVILTSQNGINWKLESSPTKNNLLKVVVSKSGLIAILADYNDTFSNSSIFSSKDGNTWLEFHQFNYHKLNDIAVNEQESFVAVGMTGAIFSSTNAITWDRKSIPSFQYNLYRVAASKSGNFVAYSSGPSPNIIIYSKSINEWFIAAAMITFQPYNILAKGESTFIVVGKNGNAAKSENNGWDWRIFNFGSNVILSTITTDYYGKFIATNEAREVLRSLNGENWTSYTICNNNTNSLRSIIKYKNQYIAVDNYGTILKLLPDNTLGTKISDTYVQLNDLITNKKNILTVGNKGTILSSVDGESWIKENSTLTSSLYSGLATISGKYLIVGDKGAILSSGDGGKKWTQESSQTNLNLYSIAEKNNILVAVGAGGTILRSGDGGKSWMNVRLNISKNIIKIINYNNKFIALTVDGLILSSVDGSKWDFENIALDNVSLNDFTCNNVVCVALGDNGMVFTTNDFKNWQKLSKINGYNLYRIMAQ